MSDEYHGVRHKPLFDEDPLFLLERGSISQKRFGTWTLDIKGFEPDRNGMECGCTGSHRRGERLPHAFFACPYCGALNAEHRSRWGFGNNVSVRCRECERHLWIRLEGWISKYWDETMKGEKACGA